MQAAIRMLFERRSVRAFTEQAIGPEEKRLILQSAAQAPSAGNQQLYTIIDVTDPTLLRRLSETCDHQPFIAEAKMALVFCADCHRWMEIYRAAGLSPRKPGPGDWMLAMADACIAAQNAVVAAQALGIGSCYIGDILENVEIHRELLKLPDGVVPAVMLVLGYPTPQQMRRKKPERFAMESIVSENAYPQHTREAIREAYSAREAAEGRARPFDESVRAFMERKYESDFSREMSRSAEVYLRMFADWKQ
jgi:nitroreductase